jgi:hypothetical protein
MLSRLSDGIPETLPVRSSHFAGAGKVLPWAIFAGALWAIAIYAVWTLPAPDAAMFATMGAFP